MSTPTRLFDVASSTLASHVRGWSGTAAFRPAAVTPAIPLILYDMENCPYCRLVREALTHMDLDVEVRPCPKEGRRFRPEVVERGGKMQLPFLIDPNTNAHRYESAEIITYVAETYAGFSKPTRGPIRSLDVAVSMLATSARPRRGYRVRPSRAPAQRLTLYSFESSPYSRLAREALCELELPYLLKNAGKARPQELVPPLLRERLFAALPAKGKNRIELEARAGRFQVPYLVDPNTSVEMFESADIVDYLRRTYGV